MPLYASVRETNITPPIGVWMSGYAFRPSGCVGVRDELFARALVLNNGDTALAILSMDLISLDFELVERVRLGVRDQTGIEPHCVMLNATHTHGGPSTHSFNSMGPRDEAYADVLVRKLIGLVKQACDELQPASVAFGRAGGQVGVNRRESVSGGLQIGRNYAGPVDTMVRALVVRDSRGEPFALLFSHACHGTTLGGENLRITGDWCGHACEFVREETGGAVTPMFLQGCCGNINPHPRGTFEIAERHGATIGQAVLAAMSEAEPVRLADARDLSAEMATIDLPLIPPASVEECRRRKAACERELEEARMTGQVGRIMHAEGMLRYADVELTASDVDPSTLTKPFTLQRLTLAGVQVLGLPAEMVVQYGLDFERQSATPAMILGYTNGVHGYVPTAADYERGGYEVEHAHRYYNSLMFTPDCERLIRTAAYDLLGIEKPSWAAYGV